MNTSTLTAIEDYLQQEVPFEALESVALAKGGCLIPAMSGCVLPADVNRKCARGIFWALDGEIKGRKFKVRSR